MYRLRWKAVYHTGSVSSEESVKKRLVIKILEQRIARRWFYLKNKLHLCGYFCGGSWWGYGDSELWREGISGGLYVSSEVCPGKIFVQSVGNADRGTGKGVRKPPVRGHNSSMGYI